MSFRVFCDDKGFEKCIEKFQDMRKKEVSIQPRYASGPLDLTEHLVRSNDFIISNLSLRFAERFQTVSN
jgi:hypothetical protein